ncbi:hypothetical protein QN277_001482 [Acacia crassicarpa]|uniref:Bifunctional inhibitor/plant lipid transfer protein/seed storage helical domain-containing protein n=1 Tax=Acacia crassicarpa TaxID=499986 RepID=A0AAE1TGU9_9FABA|nr:hypothetical protein QN277_001482 [Acacia crassicarpa]
MGGLNKKLVVVGLFLAMVAIIGSSEALRVSGDDDQGVLCGMSAQGLMDCRPSVSGQVPQVPPSNNCCSALSALSADNRKCLCRLKNSKTLLYFYHVDPKQAMALPALCQIVDSSWRC